MQALPKTSFRFGELSPQTGGRDECRGGLLLSASPLCASTGKIAGRVVFNHDTASSTHFGADRDLRFSGQRTRAVVTPQTRAGSFRRQCRGVSKRGQHCSTRNRMSPAHTLPQITLARPLIDLDVACAALGKNTKQIMIMVAARQLGWVFDLALGSRREIRILACEIARFQGSNFRTPDFTAAVNLIFPNMPPARVGVVSKISGAVIGRQLSLGSDHVLRLVREGWLRAIPGGKCRRGPGGSLEVEFSSVVEFLKQRRIA